MERKVKLGTRPTTICAIVFGIIGLHFTILGASFLLSPSDPETYTTGTVFCPLGTVFLIVGIILLCLDLKKRKRIQKIVSDGKYLWGEVAEIQVNYHVSVNNRHPRVLLIKYQDPAGNIHLFRSRDLYRFTDHSVIGKQVKVYYENESYKHYYVDIEGILPPVFEH